MSQILTISGPRGGSGKSVTALNLSVSLGLYEKKVLLVDCDPLGSASEWSGVRSLDCPFDLAAVLSGRANLIEAVSKTEFCSLDVLPSGFNLFPLSLKLSRTAENEKILKLLLRDVQGDYDYIVLDSPSSWGFFSLAALTAADRLIAAISPHAGWIGDFHALLETIHYIGLTHGIDVRMAGISLNRCNSPARACKGLSPDDLAGIRELFYENIIPEDQAVGEAVEQKIPLVLYDVNSPASQAYLGLAREIILAV